jgi:nitrilase
VIAQHDDGPGVVVGDVDVQRIAAVRADLPALKHRVIHA